MYIESLTLQNVKLIRDLEISFLNADGTPRMWTVLIGKNGRCKTTILQCIAFTASGSPQTLAGMGQFDATTLHPKNVLVQSKNKTETHEQSEYAKISSIFSNTGEGDKLTSNASIEAYNHIFYHNSHHTKNKKPNTLPKVRSTDQPGWMTLGYGVSRHLSSSDQRPTPLRPRSISRMRSLFTHEAPLLGMGFADLFEPEKRAIFTRLLQQAINHHEALFPELGGLELQGLGSVRTAEDLTRKELATLRIGGGQEVVLPATFLSHGYQSSLAWIADMIGQFVLEEENPDLQLEDLRGLVLIDELDLHLHPTWQASFIEALKQTFPNVQFVATTHSPLVLSSLRPEEIVVLEFDDEGELTARQGKEAVPDPRLKTSSELFAEFFEIHKLYPQALGAKVREYSYLAADPYRDDDEERRLQRLLLELGQEGIAFAQPVPRQSVTPMDEWPDEEA